MGEINKNCRCEKVSHRHLEIDSGFALVMTKTGELMADNFDVVMIGAGPGRYDWCLIDAYTHEITCNFHAHLTLIEALTEAGYGAEGTPKLFGFYN